MKRVSRADGAPTYQRRMRTSCVAEIKTKWVKSTSLRFRLASPRPGGPMVRQADYAKLLREDLELKESLRIAESAASARLSRPAGNKLRITIHTSRPGSSSGAKRGDREAQGDLAKKTKREVFIDIQEVHNRSSMPACVGVDRIAASKSRGVPPCDAQGPFGAAFRMQGNQVQCRP